MSRDVLFTKKANMIFYIAVFLLSFVFLEVLYLSSTKSMSEEMRDKKISFVKLTGLPDLAISSQSSFIRHRSLSDLFSVYSNDSSLREFSKSTFSTAQREIN